MKGFIWVTDMRGEDRLVATAQIRTVTSDTYNRVGAYVSMIGGGCIETRDSVITIGTKIAEAE